MTLDNMLKTKKKQESLREVKPGDPIEARQRNKIVRSVRSLYANVVLLWAAYAGLIAYMVYHVTGR